MPPGLDYPSLLRLDGRGVVVLGAGQGIGLAVCHALAQAGAGVLCVDRDARLAEEAAREIGGGIPHAGDVTNRDEMAGVVAAAERAFGDRFRGLVDIVGVADIRPLEAFHDAAYDGQLDIVLRHALLAMQLAGSALKRVGGGAMTFVGSISGCRSVPGQAVYGAAKAALHHLVRCAAHELGPSGVRVNAVAPSFVRTPRLEARLSQEFWSHLEPTIPLRRAGLPADVAAAILFLQSELARYVTGNVLMLDGGTSAVAALLPPGP